MLVSLIQGMVSAVNNEWTGTCRDQRVGLAEHQSMGRQVAETQQQKHEQLLWMFVRHYVAHTVQINMR